MSFKLWLEHAKQVFYHGTRTEYEKPKLNQDGIFWLALDPETALNYNQAKYYLEGNPNILWEITLKPNAKILDLKDLNNPIIREIKDIVSKNRSFTWGAIPDDKWEEMADFGMLEGNPWIIKFLKSKRIDGVKVKDKVHVHRHDSIALLNLRCIENLDKKII